jgi:hypothetical protein
MTSPSTKIASTFSLKKRKPPRDLPALVDWIGVVPNEVAVALAADSHGVIGGNALIGTLGVAFARPEHVRPHVVAWNVITGRQAGLEQKHRTPRIGDPRAADDHLDMARAADGVDALIGIARVAENLLVFLIPMVEQALRFRRRAREGFNNMHHLMGLVPPDQSALSLGRPL